MSEPKIYECQDCNYKAEWVMMHLRSHGGRDCPKCGGEVDQMEIAPSDEESCDWGWSGQ